MSSEIFILAFPKLRSSYVKAAQTLKKKSCEALFLMFSRWLEEPVRVLAEGLPYKYVMDEVKKQKLIPEPVGAWEYYAEPILKTLSQIKQQNPNLDIYCYGNPSYESFSNETAFKLVTLTFRALAIGKISVKEWKKVLLEELKLSLESLEDEAEFIASVADNYKKSLCICELSGKSFKEKIAEKKINTKLEYLDVPYKFTPLETLKNELLNELEGEPCPDEKIEELIRCHLNYIKKYLLLSNNPDDAYFKWIATEAKQLENILGKQKMVFTG
ncbi:hypothetical protein DRO26_01405 [Candidatus Bathyarchaeota archaeon]|nr:MAG: hypothetical protein DRO26_01405 [Candidatus Bathyarchaeota archaeon]